MRLRDIGLLPKIDRAIRLNARNPKTAVFVTTLLRPREIKLATALRRTGWKVILLYKRTTPFVPEKYFDIAIRARTDALLHRVAKVIQPRVCHVFSGAIDETVLNFCRDKPGPVVIDLNDIFAPSLFHYLQERFEPTREALSLADGLVCRDLQAKFAEKLDGFKLPPHLLFFPEYSWVDGPSLPDAKPKLDRDEVHVVSIGTFTLESDNMYDSAYLQLARMLAERRIHFHIYPHWFFQNKRGSVFRVNQRTKLADFYALAEETPYLHVHESLPPHRLAVALPQYDFGLVSGASERLGQKLNFLTENYMQSCFSGRIADYLDARLPVLINSEVVYNTRMLNHYGISIDLDGIHEEGFRNNLLARKFDSELNQRVEETAAGPLSLSFNAGRLAEFYERIIAEHVDPIRFGLWLRAATRLPVLGPRIGSLRDLAASVADLRSRLERLESEHSALTERHMEIVESNADLRLLLAENALQGSVTNLSGERRKFKKHEADELVGLLNWHEVTDEVEQEYGFGELQRIIRIFSTAPQQGTSVSAAWNLLNHKNLDQMLRDGYRRFKKTIALNYFTFPIQEGDPQIAEVEKLIGDEERAALSQLADQLPDDPEFEIKHQRHFRYHSLLLWSYAHKLDSLGLLSRLEEPLEGGPITINIDGRRASQDLANSVAEFYSVKEGGKLESAKRILEIGGGYGRDAYVFKSAVPEAQYIMIDLPPALYLAQRYLASVLRGQKIFKATYFTDFEEVRGEFESASIAFLLPHQLSLLPDGYVDVTLNISSFGEMTRDQIFRYFSEIDRVTTGQFYTKQWRESRNPFDDLLLTESDYPVRPHWRTLYSRTVRTQDAFFEALYDLENR
jgi:putative sugar O-methyltransferase